MKRILIVDRDANVRSQVGRCARLEGYEVAETGDGHTAIALCRQNEFDFVILATALNGTDGFSVCQTVRSFSQVPILILTEGADEYARIRGLELGADDCMDKPLNSQELMLRVAAILRRGALPCTQCVGQIKLDGILIDLPSRRVTVNGILANLTPKEFDLLVLLTAQPNVVFSRKKILDAVWGGSLPEDTRTLDTHIKQIRRAISPYSDRIVTLRGIGYRFELEQQTE